MVVVRRPEIADLIELQRFIERGDLRLLFLGRVGQKTVNLRIGEPRFAERRCAHPVYALKNLDLEIGVAAKRGKVPAVVGAVVRRSLRRCPGRRAAIKLVDIGIGYLAARGGEYKAVFPPVEIFRIRMSVFPVQAPAGREHGRFAPRKTVEVVEMVDPFGGRVLSCDLPVDHVVDLDLREDHIFFRSGQRDAEGPAGLSRLRVFFRPQLADLDAVRSGIRPCIVIYRRVRGGLRRFRSLRDGGFFRAVRCFGRLFGNRAGLLRYILAGAAEPDIHERADGKVCRQQYDYKNSEQCCSLALFHFLFLF